MVLCKRVNINNQSRITISNDKSFEDYGRKMTFAIFYEGFTVLPNYKDVMFRLDSNNGYWHIFTFSNSFYLRVVDDGGVHHDFSAYRVSNVGIHFAVWTVEDDGSGNLTVRVYDNGNFIGEITQSVGNISGKSDFIINRDGLWSANVGFIAIYRRALSEDEVRDLYNYVVSGKGRLNMDGLELLLDCDGIDEVDGKWYDSSGNGYVGVFDNVKVVDVKKMIRGGLYFDGVDDYVDLGESDDWLVSDFTGVIVFVPDGVNSYFYGLWNVGGGFYNGWRILLDRYYNVRFQLVFGNDSHPSVDTYNYIPNKYKVGVMNFAVFRYNHQSVDFFVNSAEVSYSVQENRDLKLSAYSMEIGRAQWFFKGDVIFVAYYNRALNDNEIKNIFDYVIKGKGEMVKDGLVLWLDWRGIDGLSNKWYDMSGRNNGIVYGCKAVLEKGNVVGGVVNE